MKCTSVILSILTIFCQAVYSQNENSNVRSIKLSPNNSRIALDSNKTREFFKSQLKIPANYEFRNQIVKGRNGQTRDTCGLGYVHEHYEQYYKGIKIEHFDIRTHYWNDSLVYVNGEYIDAQTIDTAVIISIDTAIQRAITFIGAKKYMWEDENNWLRSIDTSIKSLYPKYEVVICKNSMNSKDTMFYIAYKIDVFAKEPLSHNYVYVDAKTGKVLALNAILVNANGTAETRYSGTQNITTTYDQNLNLYALRDYTRGNGIETYNLKGSTLINESMSHAVDFTNSTNDWDFSDENNPLYIHHGILDAHWGAMMTYDYFKNIHNRNSYDNDNGVIRGYVHYGTNHANAYGGGKWNLMVYGDGDGIKQNIFTSLDIVAHEFGHCVSFHTADFEYPAQPWIPYEESASISEGMSDIWAACVKNHVNNLLPGLNKDVWLHGADVGIPYGTLARSLSNPKGLGYPDTYDGDNWSGGSNSTYYSLSPHSNGVVFGHWFYILCIGKIGQNDKGWNYNVTGIGISKAEKIIYRALTVYMTKNTNFQDARIYTIIIALNNCG